MGAVDSHAEIMKLFRKFDSSNKGYIELRDLKSIAKDLGENVSDEYLENMIAQAGTDGRVSAEQFFMVLTSKGDITSIVSRYADSDDDE